MKTPRALGTALLLGFVLGPPLSASAQFLDGFDGPRVEIGAVDVDWDFLAGDGQATMDFRQGGEGYASIFVDATADRRGIWWAFIKHKVSERMDLALLSKPGYELRIEARLRASHAPRRVNLHLNTQRTTDWHSHLMEFDIPDSENWHTISMTTRDFDARPGDTVNGQMALMDWGLEKYRVDIDYFKVDVVEAARAGPDKGAAVPYHPPVADPRAFQQQVRVAHDSIIDLVNADVNLNNWYVLDAGKRKRVLTVNGTQYVILRWDLSAFSGKQVARSGLLELTTQSLQRTAEEIKDFGHVRVAEILGGDRAWDQKTVTADSLRRGERLERVINTQMIIDWPVAEGDGSKTYFTISKPVLQRMIDGKTLGLVVRPLGSVSASFYAVDDEQQQLGARLLFDVED